MSNRLPILTALIRDLHQQVVVHEKAAAANAIRLGASLTEAKALCGHGDWRNFLISSGLPERTAQRYMRLHRYALNSDMVTDLGGIAATMQWLQPVELPADGLMLMASADAFEPDLKDPMGFVWKEGDAYHVAMLDLSRDWPHMKKTEKPILITREFGEGAIWRTLWQSLDWRCAALTFQMVPENPQLFEVAA